MSVLVVTGTSTEVGKTVATAALAAWFLGRGLRVGVCKPAQTGVADGEPGDLAEVRRLAGEVRVLELARYPEPLAPDTAARRSGRPPLALDAAADAVRAFAAGNDVTLVEGAGGLLVRLGAGGFTLGDLAAALGAPAVVVCAAGLGTLNHAALTVEALAARGVGCLGLLVGAWPAHPGLAEVCNLEDLPDITGVSLIGKLPAGSAGLDPAAFRRLAPGWIADSVNRDLLNLVGADRPGPAAHSTHQREESFR